MNRLTALKVAAIGAFLAASCGGHIDDLAGGVGSNTNWLTPCADGDSCGGGLSCLCGVCTKPCSELACTDHTECIVPSQDLCATSAQPVCVVPCASDASCVATLGSGFACVAGRCEQPASGGLFTPGTPPPSSSDAAGGGTGAGYNLVEIGELTSSPPPPECVQDLPPLLPGCDPEILAYSGIDCDGDGVPDYRLWRCEVASAERPTEFGGSYDCEPNDPGLRYWVTPDADRDGSGQGKPLCAGPVIPDGYILLDGLSAADCDDQSSAAHPGALETWGDGLDSDCSGDDGPSCDPMTLTPGAHLRLVPPSTHCAGGPDLVLSSFVHCGSRCPAGGAFHAFVANGGTAAAEGPIRVRWSDDSGASGSIEVSPGALAPGEKTQPFQVPTIRSTHTEVFHRLRGLRPGQRQVRRRQCLREPGLPVSQCSRRALTPGTRRG